MVQDYGVFDHVGAGQFLFVDGSWVLLGATIGKVHGDAAREGCYWSSYVGFFLKCTVFMGASVAIDNVGSFECWFYGAVIVFWEQLRDVMLLVEDGEFNFIVGVITLYIYLYIWVCIYILNLNLK